MVMAIQLEDGCWGIQVWSGRRNNRNRLCWEGQKRRNRLVQQAGLLTPSEGFTPTVKATLTAMGPGPRDRCSYADRQAIKAKVEDLIQKRKEEISNSPFTSPVTLVRKGKGPGLENLRLCVDCRKLNKVLQSVSWAMTLIDEIMQSFSGCEYFSVHCWSGQLCSFIIQDRVYSP